MKIRNMKTKNYLLGAVLTVFVAAGVITASIQSIAAAGAPITAATPTPTPTVTPTPAAGRVPAEFLACDRFGVPFGNKKKIKNQSEIKELPLMNRTVFNNLGINAKKKKKAARRGVRRYNHK
jgi:hypothetical protein